MHIQKNLAQASLIAFLNFYTPEQFISSRIKFTPNIYFFNIS